MRKEEKEKKGRRKEEEEEPHARNNFKSTVGDGEAFILWRSSLGAWGVHQNMTEGRVAKRDVIDKQTLPGPWSIFVVDNSGN